MRRTRSTRRSNTRCVSGNWSTSARPLEAAASAGAVVQPWMSTVHVQIEIDAPPQAVWDTVMDPRPPRRLGDDPPVGQVCLRYPCAGGARMDQVLHIRGVSFKVHWTLDVSDAPTRGGMAGSGPGDVTRADPLCADGRRRGPTTVRLHQRVPPPGGPLGRRRQPVVVGTRPRARGARFTHTAEVVCSKPVSTS